jgi:hypothetical protein
MGKIVLDHGKDNEIPKKDYGQIVHIGDSIDDCCSVISKVFDILIVIRGMYTQK